jgi:hypothetical protein
MPVKRPETGCLLHERRNGQFVLQIAGHPGYGLPWGQDRLVPIFLQHLQSVRNHRKLRLIARPRCVPGTIFQQTCRNAEPSVRPALSIIFQFVLPSADAILSFNSEMTRAYAGRPSTLITRGRGTAFDNARRRKCLAAVKSRFGKTMNSIVLPQNRQLDTDRSTGPQLEHTSHPQRHELFGYLKLSADSPVQFRGVAENPASFVEWSTKSPRSIIISSTSR